MKKTYLKQSYFVIFLCCLFLNGLAQKKAEFYLKGVIQSTGNEGVSGATLLLKDGSSGKILNQRESGGDGTFSFTVVAGNYIVSVSYLGALSYQSDLIRLTGNTDLGMIQLKTTARSLKEVVIQTSASKPVIQVDGRKMIYNVQNSISAQGGNVLEALKKNARSDCEPE
ncbi:peptidase associated/transthyretin-like domain-containing protein [Pedobacter hartonius]|uniref:Carboxypeptidase regulatory-like domain-containing protein n=1 Tax=Pedobacter hartonius TaxID=425514 RepID=A0A1H4GCM5_9SPHI|nr:hypothetical protein [Pedobacter hartonius]SEB07041.1 hypothetical protein SAMN05443550_109204 [Pedobacter hartonius]